VIQGVRIIRSIGENEVGEREGEMVQEGVEKLAKDEVAEGRGEVVQRVCKIIIP
jgi:hypothetical protein